MNNKESKTYKDMYHFTNNPYPIDRSKVPSIEADPTINTTIKKNPYRSNVEIEKGEIVLEPDLSALYKAKGKKHSGGGIDVLLKPDSFIFSDDKSLAFTEKDCENFEFKKGGKTHTPRNYTPAKVLKKNIDIEHYNTLTNNLQDIKKDDLAKKSSLMMLDKYFQTLGNIAILQESKKDFPQGVPEFAEGTAPVYDTELKGDIMEQKQYGKYGGTVGGNPKFQLGGVGGDEPLWTLRGIGRTRPYGRDASAKQKSKFVYNDQLQQWYEKIYVDNQGNPVEGPGKTLANVTVRNKPLSGVPRIELGIPPISEVPTVDYSTIPQLTGPPTSTPGNEIWSKPELPTPVPGNATGQAQAGKQVKWAFTPYQKLQLGMDALEYASVKRYMPFRSRFNPSFVDPALLNPEQAIGDLKGAAYQQSQSTNILSPILRNAQQSDIYGQLLNQMPGVRSQYDNQNVGIKNQFRTVNNQIANDARVKNMVNDQNYYRESVIGQQNFDNAKAVAATAFKNDFFQSVSDNETLALNLLAQGPNPAYSYDFKTGNYTRNPQDILDVQTNPQANVIDKILSDLLPKFDRLDPRTQSSLIRLAGVKGLPLPNSYGYKKGGKVRRNPYY